MTPRPAGAVPWLALFLLAVPLAEVLANGTTGSILEAGRASQWLGPAGPDAPPPGAWSGELELGALATGGNAEAQSAHARARALYDGPLWRHSLRLEWTFTDAAHQPPAEQYRALGKSAFLVTRNGYLFASLRYDRAVSQGIQYRFTEVLGYGRRLYQAARNVFLLEAGVGGRQTRRTDREAGLQEAVGVVQTELNWEWEEGAVFNTYLAVEYGEVNTLLLSQTALTLRVRGNLSARLGYEVTANSNPPDGIAPVDRVSSATLVYQI